MINPLQLRYMKFEEITRKNTTPKEYRSTKLVEWKPKTTDPNYAVMRAYNKQISTIKKAPDPYQRLYNWSRRKGTAGKLIFSMIPGSGVWMYKKGMAGKTTAVLDVVSLLPIGAIAKAGRLTSLVRGARTIEIGEKLTTTTTKAMRGQEIIEATSRAMMKPETKALSRVKRELTGMNLKRTLQLDEKLKLTRLGKIGSRPAITQIKRIPNRFTSTGIKVGVKTPAKATARAITRTLPQTSKTIAKEIGKSTAIRTGAKIGTGTAIAGYGIKKGVEQVKEAVSETLPITDPETKDTVSKYITLGALGLGAYLLLSKIA